MGKRVLISIMSLIFVITAVIAGLGIAFTVQNPQVVQNWFKGEEISSDAGADEKPSDEDPETPSEEDPPIEKVEITDWTFSGNSLGVYKGSADIITNIPTTYSVEQHLVSTTNTSSEEEFYAFLSALMSDNEKLYENPVKVTFSLVDLSKSYANYAEFVMDFEVLASTYDVNDLYTCTIEEFENTYYEGDDFKVNAVGLSTFANTTATTIILPEEITEVGVVAFPENVLNFEIKSKTYCENFKISTSGAYLSVYVPENLYDSYLNNVDSENLFVIEADVEPELTYSNFEDFEMSPVEASPSYSHLLAINGYTGTSTSVVIPTHFNDKHVLQINSFNTTTAVEEIVLPKEISKIQNAKAFANLESLESLTIYCQKVINFGHNMTNLELNDNCKIYVPEMLVDDYKEAWTSLADRIFAI